MRSPPGWYQVVAAIAEHLPDLRPAQQRGLAAWVYGTIQATSGCESAVLRELQTEGGQWEAWRARLREFLSDGREKAAPCKTEVAVAACFAPLLAWVVRLWQGQTLPLAIDATLDGEKLAALVLSVLYRGSAIPVAWQILPANVEGAWLPHLLALLEAVQPAVPAGWQVVVMVDRGLWSPALWDRLCQRGWHPLCRIRTDATFRPQGGKRLPVRALVGRSGRGWVGCGEAYKHALTRRRATLIVIWALEQKDPWVLLTDLPPSVVGPSWYALRFWIELGFRALKGVGWQWEHTRRLKPERVRRHWLVLAVATLWALATGTRAEDAAAWGRDPAYLRHPLPPVGQRRQISIFARGISQLRRQLARRRLWRVLWLAPEPWPELPAGIALTIHAPP
jgi:Transposase DDE domain